jgi:hypothetical protein
MITHPTAQELVESVAAWLPVDGGASGFAMRVARNALEIAARDLAQGPAADARAVERIAALLGRWSTREELDAGLAEAIRSGAILPDDPRLIAHLRAAALDALTVDQPKYAHELG